MDEWLVGWLAGWVNERMNGWMSERANEWMNDGKSEKNEKGDRHLISLSFAKHPVRKICYYLSTQSTYGANIFEPCLISTGTPYSKHTIDCICFLFVTPFFDSQCRANLFFLVNHLGEWRIIMPVNHPYCSLLYIKLCNVCVFSVFGFYRSVDWWWLWRGFFYRCRLCITCICVFGIHMYVVTIQESNQHDYIEHTPYTSCSSFCLIIFFRAFSHALT
jgi:hypothetical protein